MSRKPRMRRAILRDQIAELRTEADHWKHMLQLSQKDRDAMAEVVMHAERWRNGCGDPFVGMGLAEAVDALRKTREQ